MKHLNTAAELRHAPAQRHLHAFTPGDDFYEMLIDTHRDLSDEQSRLVNARLVLLLANHIGDLRVLREALDAARAGVPTGGSARMSAALDETHDPVAAQLGRLGQRRRHRLPDPEPAASAASAAPAATSRCASASPSATRCSTCGWPPSSAPGRRECRSVLQPLAAGDLNGFMALGPAARRGAARGAVDGLARRQPSRGRSCELCLVPQAAVEMRLPCRIGDYTDFYTGIHHATSVGKLFRPDNPLLPNYKWVPIGYHGRASSHRRQRPALPPPARPG